MDHDLLEEILAELRRTRLAMDVVAAYQASSIKFGCGCLNKVIHDAVPATIEAWLDSRDDEVNHED
jgi:hypothetical protein